MAFIGGRLVEAANLLPFRATRHYFPLGRHRAILAALVRAGSLSFGVLRAAARTLFCFLKKLGVSRHYRSRIWYQRLAVYQSERGFGRADLTFQFGARPDDVLLAIVECGARAFEGLCVRFAEPGISGGVGPPFAQ